MAYNGTLRQMSDYLTDGYWTRKYFDISASGSQGVIKYNVTGNSKDYNGLTYERANLVRDAFKYLEDVTGIDFQETRTTSGNGAIYFSDNESGAWAYPVINGSQIQYSHVNIPNDWSGGDNSPNGYTFYTILHEIGHALGLGHQGPYNGSSGSPIFLNDSRANSAMSYFDQTKVGASHADPQTMMSVDLMALDSLYGSQGANFGTKAANTGNTIYGFNTNISASTDPVLAKMSVYGNTNAYTIADGGGEDTLDLSGWSVNQWIDLRPSDPNSTAPTRSDMGGLRGNLTLAVGTIIENARGGSGYDTLIGNDANNKLFGGAGNDLHYGNNGDDYMEDVVGDDYFDGGEGNDTVSYAASRSSVYVDLLRNSNNQNDSYYSIENVHGSYYAGDTLIGHSRANKLWGSGGNDSLDGRGGRDMLDGGYGDDWLDGGYGNDTLYGGAGNDKLTGAVGNDSLWGGTGADIFYFNKNSGKDRILDFEDGIDKIVITDVSTNQLSFSQYDNQAYVTWGGNSALFVGENPADITLSDFIFA